MPPRTTPESSRPRVSDRTMVANLAIATLVGFEQRMASSLIMSMKPLRRGTRCLDEDARGPRPSTARRNPAEGLDARKHPRRPASGEKYLLTSPFIGLPCSRQCRTNSGEQFELYGRATRLYAALYAPTSSAGTLGQPRPYESIRVGQFRSLDRSLQDTELVPKREVFQLRAVRDLKVAAVAAAKR